jgi:hypothetical protein
MKRLVSVSGDNWEKRDVIATFRLVDDRVHIDGIKDVVRYFGLDSIYSGKVKKVLSPKDGADYFDALETAFSNSSRCYIETVPDE